MDGWMIGVRLTVVGFWSIGRWMGYQNRLGYIIDGVLVKSGQVSLGTWSIACLALRRNSASPWYKGRQATRPTNWRARRPLRKEWGYGLEVCTEIQCDLVIGNPFIAVGHLLQYI